MVKISESKVKMFRARKKLYLMGLLLAVGFGYFLSVEAYQSGAATVNHHDHKNCHHRHPKAHEVSNRFLFTF